MEEIKETELCRLFYKYRSDKCKLTGLLSGCTSSEGKAVYHTYSPEYFELLSPIRNSLRNMLEIGIGSRLLMEPLCGESYVVGASIRAWRDFFPNATIFGTDILEDSLFESERIKTCLMDQSSPEEIHRCVAKMRADAQENFYFDVILDDGSHLLEHMTTSIIELERYLVSGGIYIIEDIRSEIIDKMIDRKIAGLELVRTYRGEDEWDNFLVWEKLAAQTIPCAQ